MPDERSDVVNDFPYPNAIPEELRSARLAVDEAKRDELIVGIWTVLITQGIEAWDVDRTSHDLARHFDLAVEQVQPVVVAARDARLRQQADIGAYRCRTRAAFDEIEANGVLARTDFTCCFNCGSSEIEDEADDPADWRGYIFFHSQDTLKIIRDGAAYIAYGLFEPDDEYPSPEQEDAQMTAMLDEVVLPILRRHGIEPEWDRDTGTRVAIRNADWYTPLQA